MARELIVPIAEWWRERAVRRGQTSTRVIPRGVNEIWPQHHWESPRQPCPAAKELPLWHTDSDICRNCGTLIRR